MPVPSQPIEGGVYSVQTGPGVQSNNSGGGTQYIHFEHCFNSANPNPLRTLWDLVGGIGASHNSEHQFQRGGCLDGTRNEVLRVILAWIASRQRSLPILWLSGAAGVGKSAIAITVARALAGKGLVTSFFFFRSDPRRNNPSALMVSISHGLWVNMPFAKSYINQRISDDPAILDAQMEDQFRELVVKPSLRWKWWRRLLAKLSGDNWASKDPDLVIIDGLDECADEHTQKRILAIILSSYQQFRRPPLRFLICSRPEAWIQAAFKKNDLSQLTEFVVLDERFVPDQDIERYYLHEFQLIREEEKYSRVQFPTPWPSPEDLNRLTRKSAGQFVYAVTAVSFIRSASPLLRLRAVLDYTPENRSPDVSFSTIDGLYHVILSSSPHREQLLSILAAVFLLPPYAPSSPEFIEFLLGLSAGEVDAVLWSLHSVLIIQGGDVSITAYHTSFTDYLYDPLRSGEFHIDRDACHHTLVIQWLDALTRALKKSSILEPDSWTVNVKYLLGGWYDLCLADKRAADELLGRSLRCIISAFPDPQQLLTTLASIVLLSAFEPDWMQLSTLIDFILGHGEAQFPSTTMKLVGACQSAKVLNGIELEPFFLKFLYDPSHEYYIDLPRQRHHIAQRWIQALVPSNQPISRPDWAQQTLWTGWADFCNGIEHPNVELLFDLQALDLVAVAGVNSSTALVYESSPSMVARPFKTIVSWLKSVDPPVPSVLINRFLDAAKPFEWEDVVERNESSLQHRLAAQWKLSDQRLDCLYHAVLSTNPGHEQLHLMITAILVLPRYLKPTPARIGLLLGVPTGHINSRFRVIYAVVNIGGPKNVLGLHTLFRNYIVDKKRSGPFHIGIRNQTHAIARQWLQSLSIEKTWAYSSSQLWEEENAPFFKEWITFCTLIPEPTRDLLDALSNVDLVATFIILGSWGWKGVYQNLVPWVRKYRSDPTTGENHEVSEIRDHTKAGNSHLEVNGHLSSDNSQSGVEDPSRGVTDRRDDLDLVERLVRKFEDRPQCFHLEYPQGISPPDEVVHWIVRHTTSCLWDTKLGNSRPSATHNIRLTECRCDLSGGDESHDPLHLAYQEACLKLAKAYVYLFEELSESGTEDKGTIDQLTWIFSNLMDSALLKLCCLDTELLSLCRTFFGLAEGCLIIRNKSSDMAGIEDMVKWFETFPNRFATEGETLKAQLLGLPWERWNQNWMREYDS